MNDRMTTARDVLTKAERNRQLAEECEGAAALLTAQ